MLNKILTAKSLANDPNQWPWNDAAFLIFWGRGCLSSCMCLFLSCGKECAQLCTTITAFPGTFGVLYKSTIIIITYTAHKLRDGNTQVRKPYAFHFTSIKLLQPPLPEREKNVNKMALKNSWPWLAGPPQTQVSCPPLQTAQRMLWPPLSRQWRQKTPAPAGLHPEINYQSHNIHSFPADSTGLSPLMPHNIHSFPSDSTGLSPLMPQDELFSTGFHRAFHTHAPQYSLFFHQIPQGFPHSCPKMNSFPPDSTGLSLSLIHISEPTRPP